MCSPEDATVYAVRNSYEKNKNNKKLKATEDLLGSLNKNNKINDNINIKLTIKKNI